jgi:hypothetical protein
VQLAPESDLARKTETLASGAKEAQPSAHLCGHGRQLSSTALSGANDTVAHVVNDTSEESRVLGVKCMDGKPLAGYSLGSLFGVKCEAAHLFEICVRGNLLVAQVKTKRTRAAWKADYHASEMSAGEHSLPNDDAFGGCLFGD